ncbi:MAG: NifB/NifX family molybdenum-iron cluster-binding protein [Phycisphaerae bacterium]|jgi:predicted Fe-Mo cluster-binding NifX family protein
MRVAVPVWGERVSPVFDVANRLLMADIEGDQEIFRNELILDEREPGRRAQRVAELHVDVLICGAISEALETMLTSAGVEVVAQICGPTDEVLHAFVSGRLTGDVFLMPGCGNRRRIGRRRSKGKPRSRIQGDAV